MTRRSGEVKVLLPVTLLYSNSVYAAGVDAVLLIPAGWLIALGLFIASIIVASKKLVPVVLHAGSAAFYITVAYIQTGHDWTFPFLLFYPVISSVLIFLVALALRGQHTGRQSAQESEYR